MGKPKSKVRSLIRKLGGYFRGRPKIPEVRRRRSQETTGGGHRGVAIGSRKNPDYSAENVGKWRSLPASTVEAFVYEQAWFPVHSTNVAAMQYFIDEQVLLVEFLDGKTYKYKDVSEQEAIEFAKAPSKGAAVWDMLRVRGSRTAHKKKYERVARGYKAPGKKAKKVQIDGDFYEVTNEGDSTRYRLMD